MQLTPRYEGGPPLSVELPMADPSVPLLRQRRRMADVLGTLETEQWRVASRCSGWSIQDVIAHLVGTNRFWSFSINSGLAGSPTRFLVDFDPVTTPPLLIEPMRSLTPAEVLHDFTESIDELADAVGKIDITSWDLPAEAPPGHISIRAVALHALWDAWVHERDILLPLGLAPVEEADEVTASLLYVAILGPSLLAGTGARSGKLVIEAYDPTIRFVVDAENAVVAREAETDDADVPRLTGRAVDLVEGLSARIPLRHDLTLNDQWLVDGLVRAFDRTVA